MDAGTARATAAQQRGNLTYFLFLSLMFFMMNSGPDMTTEQNWRNSLRRLTAERDQYKEWLYPGSTNGTDDGRSGMTSSLLSQPAASTTLALPPSQGGNGTTSPNDGSEDEQEEDPIPDTSKPFQLEDLTPPEGLLQERIDQLLLDKSHEQGYPSLYYRNITGFFKGSYMVHPELDILPNRMNQTEAESQRGHFPWLGESARKGTAKESSGKVVRMTVREAVPHKQERSVEWENEHADIVMIRGDVHLQLHDMVYNDTKEVDPEMKGTTLSLEGLQCVCS